MSTLYERFVEIAQRHPDNTAVVDDTGRLTYAELRAEADELGTVLAKHADPADRLVVLRHRRDRHSVVGLLGVLAGGFGYVPVDPGYPAPRRAQLETDSGAGLVVTSGPADVGDERLATVGRVSVGRVSGAARGAAPRRDLPDDLAYVIYTSGSTGVPKGCMVGHAQVLAFLGSWTELVAARPDDVWTQFHSTSFDFSVLELWSALLTGATAVVVGTEVASDPGALVDLLIERRVTVLCQTPSMFSNLCTELDLSDRTLPALRCLVIGGEAIRLGDIDGWYAAGRSPNAQMINIYGPTETTVAVTAGPLTATDGHVVTPGPTPIGRALPHAELSIRDEAGRPTPPGTPGELWIAGAGVAHGYLNAPELTAERFVVVDGRRHYRSGDWVVSPDGPDLFFVGRRDGQVKVRGFRLELGEIETALVRLDGVRAAAAGVTNSPLGHQILTVHVVTDPDCGIDAGQIRAHLAGHLPPQCLPNRITRVGEMPITINGKLDRAALMALPAIPW
jgi:nonribosomal peptide synthetase DhbF